MDICKHIWLLLFCIRVEGSRDEDRVKQVDSLRKNIFEKKTKSSKNQSNMIFLDISMVKILNHFEN